MMTSIPQFLLELFIAVMLGFIIAFPIVLFWFSRKLKKIKKQAEIKQAELKGGNKYNAQEEIRRYLREEVTGGENRGEHRGNIRGYRPINRDETTNKYNGNQESPGTRQGVSVYPTEPIREGKSISNGEQRDNEEDWPDFD